MITKVYIPLLMAMIISFVGCENSKENEKTKDEISAKKEQLEESLTQIKSNLDERISELTEDSKQVGEDAKMQVTAAIEKLQAERKKVLNLLDDVDKASEDGLEQLEKDVNQARNNLVNEFQQISEDSKDWFEDQMKDRS